MLSYDSYDSSGQARKWFKHVRPLWICKRLMLRFKELKEQEVGEVDAAGIGEAFDALRGYRT